MTEQEILEGNKLIAEFMGWKFNPQDEKGDWMLNENGATFPFSAMKWHSSWDSLMPVVEKIESNPRFPKFNVFVIGRVCRINIYAAEDISYQIILQQADSKIEAVWLAMVEYVKWYNQNKPY